MAKIQALRSADYFKKINDTYGHAAGDEVLRRTGDLLNQMRITDVIGRMNETGSDAAISDTDVIGRIGGEEFAVIATHTSFEDAKIVAERLRKKIESMKIEIDGAVIPVTASIGVAAFDADYSGPELAMQKADLALYRAKEGGRNRVAVYTAEIG